MDVALKKFNEKMTEIKSKFDIMEPKEKENLYPEEENYPEIKNTVEGGDLSDIPVHPVNS